MLWKQNTIHHSEFALLTAIFEDIPPVVAALREGRIQVLHHD
jgi:hypothetical protein